MNADHVHDRSGLLLAHVVANLALELRDHPTLVPQMSVQSVLLPIAPETLWALVRVN